VALLFHPEKRADFPLNLFGEYGRKEIMYNNAGEVIE